jgi:hypothetical protein
MANKSAEQRNRVETALDRVRHQIGLVLGAAAGARQAAEADLAKLELERDIVRVGMNHASTEQQNDWGRHPAAHEVFGALGAVRGSYYTDWSQGPATLRELVAQNAPGPAGQPAGEWLGQVGGNAGLTSPGLWRVGSATAAGGDPTRKFDVAVPLLDESHLAITSAPKTRPTIDGIVQNLLIRLLSTFEPGAVRVHLWDVGQLTAILPDLYPLNSTSALSLYDPGRLEDLLDELAGHIRRIHATGMQAGHTSLRELRIAQQQRIEPFRVAVLYGNGETLEPERARDLKRVASGALAAGICLIMIDVPTAVSAPVETLSLTDDRHAISSMAGTDLIVELDPPMPSSQVLRAADKIAKALIAKQGGPRSFDDLLPAELGHHSSARELRAPVGFFEGEPVEVVIGDASPHALIGGPSGSGKTNFLYALLGSLSARYPPHELALYLLDFKEGVSFAGLAPGRKDASWLPHARLVGVNVNTDREFGLALLRFLTDELRRRSSAAKEHEVTNLADLREADPNGHWPRIVAVIDEFQYLFAGRDQVTATATQLLEDIARRGRSQGIHMVLASQDVAGIEAFWGKPAVFEQCTLRIAMPKARRVLAETNNAAVSAPKWHAVINHDSGIAHGNQLSHVPDASSKNVFVRLQRRLWEEYQHRFPRPRLFDGAHSPVLEHFPAFLNLKPDANPKALLGQSIDVTEAACGVDLPRAPGRNVAVLGSATAEALSIMDSAARSLSRQYEAGEVEFVVHCPIETCAPAASELTYRLRDDGHAATLVDDLTGVLESMTGSMSGGAKILLLYGVDAALPSLEAKAIGQLKSGLDHLRMLLKQGPSHGIHTIGWWRSIARLKDTLSFAGTDDIGAWAALDVQGNELAPFAAGQVVHWSPRPGRALFFDRTTHGAPEVIIPFQRPENAL